MRDIAIFSPEVVEALISKGFKPVSRSKKAWYFEDSDWLRIALDEILQEL